MLQITSMVTQTHLDRCLCSPSRFIKTPQSPPLSRRDLSVHKSIHKRSPDLHHIHSVCVSLSAQPTSLACTCWFVGPSLWRHNNTGQQGNHWRPEGWGGFKFVLGRTKNVRREQRKVRERDNVGVCVCVYIKGGSGWNRMPFLSACHTLSGQEVT